jgi:hypothetical protein
MKNMANKILQPLSHKEPYYLNQDIQCNVTAMNFSIPQNQFMTENMINIAQKLSLMLKTTVTQKYCAGIDLTFFKHTLHTA